jgi:hypothetical protein
MKSLPLLRRVDAIEWSSQTRRLQVGYGSGYTLTFFNVTEEDFEEVKSSKLLSLAVMRLLKKNQYPTDFDSTR